MKKYKSTPVKKHPSGYAHRLESAFPDSIDPVIESPEAFVEAGDPDQPDFASFAHDDSSVADATPVLTLDDLIDSSSSQAPEPDANSLTEDKIENEPSRSRLWGFQKKANPIQPSVKTEPIVQKEKITIMKNETTLHSAVESQEASAVISKLMSVSGNIDLDSSLLLAGRVTGNIECKDDVQVLETGYVEGNLSVKSIRFVGGEIKGNIVCSGTLETDSATVINGDISASVIILCGKVTGQVKAAESVSLSSSAIVKGDLYSASISVEKGAVLEGKYSVSAQ